MQEVKDYPIFDWLGGVVTNKSTYELQENEFPFGLDIVLEKGRVRKRYGSKQFGGFKTTPSATEVFAYGIYNQSLASFIMSNKNSGAVGTYYKLTSGFVSTAIVVGATTINYSGGSDFGATGTTVEIEGDVITYTGGGGGAGTLTGVSGITSAHPIGAAIHQWVALAPGTQGTDQGVWFAYLNSLMAISRGSRGYDTYDGSTVTSRISANAPNFITTYKQRIYGAGLGVSNLSTVYYTNLTDPTSFPAANNFVVEDDRGEPIVNLKSFSGRLAIFKPNSTFHYNLSTLSLANDQIGAYNDQCVQEINGLLYTICPRGTFITNLSSFNDISKPVEKFLKAAVTDQFPPKTGRDGDLWLIYLGDMTIDQTAFTDVVLVYDTQYKYWTVWDGFTNLAGFVPLESYQDNYSTFFSAVTINKMPTCFWGNSDQKFFRLFNDRTFANNGATADAGVIVGGDLTSDQFYDSGTAIPSQFVTRFYTQNLPNWWKKFRYVRVVAELWPFDIECRVITQTGYSNWKALGQVTGPNQVLKINLEGYAIQFRIMESSKNDPWILNGLIIESTELISQNHY